MRRSGRGTEQWVFMPRKNTEIIQGDCLEVLDTLRAKRGEFADLVFCDPPYHLSNGGVTCQNGKMVAVDKGKWDRSAGFENNLSFNLSWIERCKSILKPHGTIMISGTLHSIYSIGFAMQKVGMKLLNNITWQKPNPPPNLSCRYLTHSTETIIWAAKDQSSKHMFNYQLMKKMNNGKQMKDVWTMTAPNKSEKMFGKHPTQKPLSLMRQLILSSTKEGDTVLDAFNGSGTTGVAAIETNRKYVGIELDPVYVTLSENRFSDARKRTKRK